MKKISLIKSKKYVIYAKKDLVLIMIIKSIIKSEIIVTTQGNIEGLLIVFVIEDIKHQKKSHGFTYDYNFIIKGVAKNLSVNLNAWEKTQRNILLFEYQLKRNLIMVKHLNINYSLLVALD